MSTVDTMVPIGRAEVYLQRVLSPAGAARAAMAVLDAPPAIRTACWHEDASPATIGAPLYRNRARPDYYRDRARATNHLLYETYRDLYERVAAVFDRRYAVPVVFVDDLAVPGFHLMRYAVPGVDDGGSWHYDQLAGQVPYLVEHAAEVRGVVNFTLPLAVPSGGGGMDVIDRGPDGDGTGTEVHVPYQPGVMLFNEQELQHRIGPSRVLHPGECRLTLQGHGVHFRGRLLLFW
jgi:hypothetical protein